MTIQWYPALLAIKTYRDGAPIKRRILQRSFLFAPTVRWSSLHDPKHQILRDVRQTVWTVRDPY
jgi:hypothetical protein